MNREIHPLSSKFNFLIRYCGIVAVTLYCGFMGLIGGIILSGFVLQKFGWTFSTVSSPSTEDLAEWIGGALVGALPLGFIGANWMGRKVGWLK